MTVSAVRGWKELAAEARQLELDAAMQHDEGRHLDSRDTQLQACERYQAAAALAPKGERARLSHLEAQAHYRAAWMTEELGHRAHARAEEQGRRTNQQH